MLKTQLLAATVLMLQVSAQNTFTNAPAATTPAPQNVLLYDTFTEEPLRTWRQSELTRLDLLDLCTIPVRECDPNERRRLDNSCNNLNKPSLGATLTRYHRVLPPEFGANFDEKPASTGEPLPGVRDVRVAVMTDGRVPSKRYTHFATHFAVFLTSDITSVILDVLNYILVTPYCCQAPGVLDPRCVPNDVPADDVFLRRSGVRCMNLTRPLTYQDLGCAPRTLPPERFNLSPPMLELTTVYGQTEARAQRARERRGGRLTAELIKGREWPPNGPPICVNNQPPLETRCHDSANIFVNSILGINILYIWFFRNHNYIARKLEALNPCWDDEELYMTARDINIAFYQHIIYYHLMPDLMGAELLLKNKVIYDTDGYVNDYDEHLEPRISVEYATATRWFHTMQEGRLKLYDRFGKLYDEVNVVDFTFRTGALPVNNTIEGMTQGIFRQATGKADHVVDPDVGERILGGLQFSSDVIASDTRKGRLVGLQSYNSYRKVCGLPTIQDFQDLYKWMPKDQADAFKMRYDRVEDIDLMAALLGEKFIKDWAITPTLACIMIDQLVRWRRADRFFYENSIHPGTFTPEQLHEVRGISMARILCNIGDDVEEIQRDVFIVPGLGNEITQCSNIPEPDYEAWRDQRCLERDSSRDMPKTI